MTRVPLRLEAVESVFVVFRPGQMIVRSGRFDDPERAKLRGKGATAKDHRAQGRLWAARRPGRTRNVKAKLQRLFDASGASLPVARVAEGDGDPAINVVKTLVADLLVNGKPVHISVQDPQTIDVEADGVLQTVEANDPPRVVDVARDRNDRLWLEVWRTGATA